MSTPKMILVIDDDPDILEAVKAILGSQGYAVRTATSAQEGFASVIEAKPHLVLCDMMMESMDAGITFAQSLMSRFADVPIYLMSSIGDLTAATTEIGRLGFRGVFQKPIDPHVLIKTVEGVLAN